MDQADGEKEHSSEYELSKMNDEGSNEGAMYID
jgi:hypothetical protein